MMLICGFNSHERAHFLKVLMHFGPPFVHQDTEAGWVPYDKQFGLKTRQQVRWF
jgi:hypothetical protein